MNLMEKEILINEVDHTRLQIEKLDKGDVAITITDDRTNGYVRIVLSSSSSEIRIFLETLNRFNSEFVNGDQRGSQEIITSNVTSSTVVNHSVVHLSAERLAANFTEYYLRTGVFIDGRDISYKLKSQSFYNRDHSDIEVLIAWLNRYGGIY